MVSYLFYHLQFLENYFHQYKVPSGMKINDGIWKDLFREVVKRWLNNLFCLNSHAKLFTEERDKEQLILDYHVEVYALVLANRY